MHRILRARLLASVLVVSVVPFVAAAVPAQAQMRGDVSFDTFHDQLAGYGDWVYSDRWGMVWQPADVPNDFRPYYSDGHWAYTNSYGWTWISDYDWGDIAFHYGRWVDDPYDGWMWIPGYSWSPGWVVWRSNRQSVGWMPMPPDDNFLGGRGEAFIGISFGGVSVNWNNTSGNYGYSRWYGKSYDNRRFAANWTFVDTGHMTDRDYRRVAYAPTRTVNIIRQTTNITNYTVVNNYMVNRSVDVRAVERASGHPVVAVAAATVVKHPNLVTTVDVGQKARAQQFAFAPHGTGVANSAPPPPPAVINKLSDHVAAHHAGGTGGTGAAGGKSATGPTHLFTKATIASPAAVTQFHGKPLAGPTGATPATAPVTPGGPPGLHAGPTGGAPVTTTTGPGKPTGPNAGHPTGTTPAGTAPTPSGPKALHAGPTGGAPSTATTGPAKLTGPNAGHPTGANPAGTPTTPGGPQGLHAGPTGGAPVTTTTGPAKLTGPNAAHPAGANPAGTAPTPSGPKALHAGPTGGAPSTATAGPSTTTGTTGGPSGHAVRSGPITQPHPVPHPVTPPVVHTVTPPVEHTVTPPVEHVVTPPVVHTVTPPVEHAVTPPAEHAVTPAVAQPAPVVDTPPAAVHDGNPPASAPSDRKKNKGKEKQDQTP